MFHTCCTVQVLWRPWSVILESEAVFWWSILDVVSGLTVLEARPWYMVAVSLSNQWSFKFVFRPSFWGFHLEIQQPQLLAMC